MNASATNFTMVVPTWTEPMFLTPDRLIAAGIHSPTSTSSTVIHLVWPLLMKCSTYRTQPTAIAALPAQAVIPYDQALANPSRGGDPGRRGVGDPQRVAYRVPPVRGRPAAGGHPPRQGGEQQCEHERA